METAAERVIHTAVADIDKFGLEVRDGVVFIPAIHTGSPPPAQIMRELSCGCRSERTCVGGACGCQAKHIPCTIHCKLYRIVCSNPYSVDKSVDIEDDDEEVGEID